MVKSKLWQVISSGVGQSEPFPVDLDDASAWWDCRTKDGKPLLRHNLVRKLKANYYEGVNYHRIKNDAVAGIRGARRPNPPLHAQLLSRAETATKGRRKTKTVCGSTLRRSQSRSPKRKISVLPLALLLHWSFKLYSHDTSELRFQEHQRSPGIQCPYVTMRLKNGGVTSRQTARYLEKARHLMAQEAAIARRNEFDYHLVIRRHLYSVAYRDRNWRLCLDILKDEAQLLGCYPTKVSELEAIRQLAEAGVLPLEVLERISTALGQFQQSMIAAFKFEDDNH